MSLMLSDQAFIRAAEEIGCDVCVIRALDEVESSGSGFDPEGYPKTLFEGHWFSKLTKRKFDQSHPTLSYPKWTRKFYGDWRTEKRRLQEAIKLDRRAALMSASWGRFQILGVNHAPAGYPDVEDFVAAMCESEDAHLGAFVEFVIARGLADELASRNYSDFFRGYNGPGYKANNYDGRFYEALRRCMKSRQSVSQSS